MSVADCRSARESNGYQQVRVGDAQVQPFRQGRVVVCDYTRVVWACCPLMPPPFGKSGFRAGHGDRLYRIVPVLSRC